MFRAIRASAPGLINGKQFERTVSLIDVSETNFYLVDIFRVVGGTNHARFLHAFSGSNSMRGLNFESKGRGEASTVEFGHGTQTRAFRRDMNARPGWDVTWNLEDRFNVLPKGKQVGMRYTDFTTDAQAWVGDAWIVAGYFTGSSDELWNRCIVTRREGAAPLTSTFVGLYEPFTGSTNSIIHLRRLPLVTASGQPYGDGHVALEITFLDGTRDLFMATDVENVLQRQPAPGVERKLVQPDWKVTLDGELGWLRKNQRNALQHVAFHGASIQFEQQVFQKRSGLDFTEIRVGENR